MEIAPEITMPAVEFLGAVDRLERHLDGSGSDWPVTADLRTLVAYARNTVRPDDDELVSHALLFADGYVESRQPGGPRTYRRHNEAVTVYYDGTAYRAATCAGDFSLVSMGHLRQLRGGLLRAGL